MTYKEAFEKAIKAANTMPDNYGAQDQQLKDIWFALEDKLPKNPTIVELGVCWARASVVLAEMAKYHEGKYHGVDCWILAGSADHFWKAMRDNGLDDVCYLHEGMTAIEAEWVNYPVIPWNLEEKIDFLFIDASHTEPFFSADCVRWIPLVKPGGFIYFDDWTGYENEKGKFVPVTKEMAAASEEGGEKHDPHWAVSYYGSIYTKGWESYGLMGNHGNLMRKPNVAQKI